MRGSDCVHSSAACVYEPFRVVPRAGFNVSYSRAHVGVAGTWLKSAENDIVIRRRMNVPEISRTYSLHSNLVPLRSVARSRVALLNHA